MTGRSECFRLNAEYFKLHGQCHKSHDTTAALAIAGPAHTRVAVNRPDQDSQQANESTTTAASCDTCWQKRRLTRNREESLGKA